MNMEQNTKINSELNKVSHNEIKHFDSALVAHDISDTAENIKPVHQSSVSITKHNVKKGYLILSKNDFGMKKRINLGYFNKKTNFIISEENSLILFNKKLNKLVNKNITEIIEKTGKNKNKDYNDYFMCNYISNVLFQNFNNLIRSIKIKETEILLDFVAGFYVGKKLISEEKNSEKYIDKINFLFERLVKEESHNTVESLSLLDRFILIDDKIKSIDKRLLVNVHPHFLIGILASTTFFGKEKFVFKNINIYNFTAMLNSLGASYSIRKNENKDFQLRYKLPPFYKQFLPTYIFDKTDMFRYYAYVFNQLDKNSENSVELTEIKNHLQFSNKNLKENFDYYFEFCEKTKDMNIIDLVNSGVIILSPIKDYKFIEIKNFTGYDIVTEGRTLDEERATNFHYPFLPFMKNSDGDVLAVIALWSKQAAKDAEDKFSIFAKENHFDILTGDNYNWIQHDAILGYYNFTK